MLMQLLALISHTDAAVSSDITALMQLLALAMGFLKLKDLLSSCYELIQRTDVLPPSMLGVRATLQINNDSELV